MLILEMYGAPVEAVLIIDESCLQMEKETIIFH